jgi:2,5-dioxopentanoate dehydrogenase
MSVAAAGVVEKVLVDGQWRAATREGIFRATNPSTRVARDAVFPISHWSDIDAALEAAQDAYHVLRSTDPSKLADFLEDYAARIEQNAERLVQTAHEETGLPIKPRLADVELPRTTNQLRQAAAAARSGDWAMATIDTKANIRSVLESIGPVCVFGPNNFPFAYNSVAGGDFAAAIATGNPVIGKANSSHPETTQRLAELALQSLEATGLPKATVQLIYRTNHADGERMVSDRRTAATGYTGSRSAGLALKQAADRAGKPIYLELSSVNPVVVLPGAMQERGDEIANEYLASVLMGAGQFCTNPGLVLAVASDATTAFVQAIAAKFSASQPGTLLSPGVEKSLVSSIATLERAGAKRLAGDGQSPSDRCAVSNTLLQASGTQFLADPETYQTEAFGNAALVVVCKSVDELSECLNHLEGNLTGSIYSSKQGTDAAFYRGIADRLRHRVGRFLNDKMPTGVAVSPAMNHGGPYPATGHSFFSAVGVPVSLIRFGKLTCYDNVRPEHLPPILQAQTPTGKTWRRIDGRFEQS